MSTKLATANVQLKRAYDAVAADDGTRVLIDRLWPRGVRKADAAIDLWLKEIAPSAELRKWFGHDPALWTQFRERYSREVQAHQAEFDQLVDIARRGRLTLVYGARDEEHNDAVVLRELLLAAHT